MKTLYVTDLDGTLLRSDETVSAFTANAVNGLVEKGMLFSYATARSYVTAAKVTKGIEARIPLIVYNGALVIDHGTGEILISNFFDDGIRDVIRELVEHDIFPIVYAFIGGAEKYSYLPKKCTWGMQDYIASRSGDRRENPVTDPEALCCGEIFYISCIDEEKKLEPFFEKYKERFHAVYQKDIYSGAQWLELMPQAASKSNAARQLKALLGCGRMVAFGDGKNDIDMFELADESYAVENAAPELKAAATGVIGGNNEDAVAKWLLEHADVK